MPAAASATYTGDSLVFTSTDKNAPTSATVLLQATVIDTALKAASPDTANGDIRTATVSFSEAGNPVCGGLAVGLIGTPLHTGSAQCSVVLQAGAHVIDISVGGNYTGTGQGQITARQAAVKGGIPMDVPALTVNKVCLSGLNAIAMADQLISVGEFDVVVAGRRSDSGEIDILMIEGEAPDKTWELLASGAQAPTEETVAEGLEAAKRKVKSYVRLQMPWYECSEKGTHDEKEDPKPLGVLGTWWHETLRILGAIDGQVPCSLSRTQALLTAVCDTQPKSRHPENRPGLWTLRRLWPQ